MSKALRRSGEQKTRAALLFIVASFWVAVSLTGGRVVAVVAPALWNDAVRQCVTAVLLFAGLYLIARLGVRDLRALSSIGFVQRPSARREFALGLALGWGVALALIVPAVLTGNFRVILLPDAPHLLRLLLSAVTLSAFAMCVQLIVAGLPARLLLRSAGPSWTVIAMMLLAFCMVLSGQAGGDGIVFAVIAAALFATAFLRTRACWLPLGLQLGWTLVLQLIFGVPSPYTPVSSGVVRTDIGGAFWLTGALAGPEASGFAPIILLGALVVLVRVTRDYAWHYTYQPLDGAAYPVELQPSAAHVLEETRATVPLVQIGGIAPAGPVAPSDPLR